MSLEILIERWFAIGWLVFGLSHLLYPAQWADLFLSIREREAGALILGLFYLPLGLGVVLAHNVWGWRIPTLVTLAGWVMVLKSTAYLLYPQALARIMPAREQMAKGFRMAGALSIILGALLAYYSFGER